MKFCAKKLKYFDLVLVTVLSIKKSTEKYTNHITDPSIICMTQALNV